MACNGLLFNNIYLQPFIVLSEDEFTELHSLFNKLAAELNYTDTYSQEVVEKNVQWHVKNGIYIFSYALGSAIIIISLLTLFGVFNARLGLLGGLLTFGMSLVTLSFLMTTPETWVPDLGGPSHGFPYLSAAGRLVIKDVIIMAGGLLCASDCAASILKKRI